MRDYICEFVSTINFCGGPGEVSHKTFANAPPGLKTQHRAKVFSTQMADGGSVLKHYGFE